MTKLAALGLALGIASLAGGCAPLDLPELSYDLLGDADEELDPLCEEDYAMCGDVLIPSPLGGTPVRMAVALYRNIPPAGPPFATIIDDEMPDVPEGGRYKVRVRPVLEEGDFYVWSNLYMEDGGDFVPKNGVDFVGNTEPQTFDVAPVIFPDITLVFSEGF
ncbi:MAG: hypothetical protein KDA24_26090 [Deltaproteobacteria bacterium]|nr:hypothetical protein [Deltaproteobacteria bacterium]